jgi:sec-independent protein translocase protein TatC
MSKLQTPNSADDSSMSLIEHLVELKRAVVISLFALGIGFAVCMVFAEEIFTVLAQPMEDALAKREGGGNMTIIAPLEGVMTWLRVGFFGGVVLSFPVIAYQIWWFIAPGLEPREKRRITPLVFASVLLMLLGASFGYFVIFRFGFPFFLSIMSSGAEANISLASYFSTSLKLMVGFGVCFQLPVVIYFCARMGLLDARDMIEKFRYGIVIIFMVSAFMTPPDPMTQVLMAAPLTVLYVLSIGVAHLFSTKERMEDEEDEEDEAP